MNSELLLGLDADEIFATRENLEAAIRLRTGPEARRIPEGLCAEVDQLLYLLELAVRKSQEISIS